MSAGHGHRRAHTKRPKELAKLEAQPDYQRLWQRWQHIDTDHDMPDLAGYNLWGTVTFVDRDFWHALLDPNYARHLGIGPIDTGLSPEDTIACLIRHERIEKTLMDAGSNNVDTYLPAHEFATLGEHEEVRDKGSTPLKYEDGLEKAIEFCEKKIPHRVPRDFACSPLIDDPDDNDKRVLVILKHMGVIDAGKISKEKVQYSKSTGADRCDGCTHWIDAPQTGDPELGLCEIVCGVINADRWCAKYQKAEQEDEAPGVQGGGEEDRAEPEDQEPGGGPGGGDAPGEPPGQEGEPEPQAS